MIKGYLMAVSAVISVCFIYGLLFHRLSQLKAIWPYLSDLPSL